MKSIDLHDLCIDAKANFSVCAGLFLPMNTVTARQQLRGMVPATAWQPLPEC